MTIEEQLKERLNFHWKGFRGYDELDKQEKYDDKKMYSIQELYNAMKEAYNLGIEIAASNAKIACLEPDDVGNFTILNSTLKAYTDVDNERYYEVYRDSILNLKIL